MVQEQGKGIWWVTGASVKGATHGKSGLPNQDAICLRPDTEIVVLSTADGHGSEKYFRSDKGAEFAVQVADEAMYRFGKGHAGVVSLSAIEDDAKRLPWQIVSQWRQMVEQDWEGEKLGNNNNKGEEEWLRKNALGPILDNHAIPYGATLLTILLTERFILYLQLGDGDILTVATDGSIDEPVPGDERNLANETTSLCDPKAARDFRMQFQRLAGKMPALIMLSTDGYSNSFREREGFHKVGSDIWQLIRSKGEEGLKTVEDSLEGWLKRATQTGSGDDITVGLLCRLSALKEVVPIAITPSHGKGSKLDNPPPIDERATQHGLPGEAAKIGRSPSVSGQEGGELLPTDKKGDDPLAQKHSQGENLTSPVGASSQTITGFLTTPSPLDRNGRNPSPNVQPGSIEPVAMNITSLEQPAEVKEDLVPVGSPATPRLPSQVLIVSEGKREGYYYTSIGEAIKNAEPRAEIRVFPGVYNEKSSIDIKKPISIIGIGLREEIVVRISVPCIQMLTDDDALVQGISIQGLLKPSGSTVKDNPAIAIHQGRLVLSDCSITSASKVCVHVDGSKTAPHIMHCDIYRESKGNSGGEKGLVFSDHSKGEVEHCCIDNHLLANVEIDNMSAPILRYCKIRGGQQYGILAWWNCQGTIEDCEISGSNIAGINIDTGGNPTIGRCKIHHSRFSGILVTGRSQGTIKHCHLEDNVSSGIVIQQESDPKISNCTISNSTRSGILINEKGHGVLEDCKITDCGRAGTTGVTGIAGIEIRAQSEPVFRRCSVSNGQYHGIYITDMGIGTMEDCDIVDNARIGIVIKGNSRATITSCTINNGQSYGISFSKGSVGRIDDSHINGNANYGIEARDKSYLIVKDCDISGNGVTGMDCQEESTINKLGDIKL